MERRLNLINLEERYLKENINLEKEMDMERNIKMGFYLSKENLKIMKGMVMENPSLRAIKFLQKEIMKME